MIIRLIIQTICRDPSGSAVLHCAGSGHAEAATSAADQIVTANSSNATATRRLAGSSTANS
jgi:hypothetical protein